MAINTITYSNKSDINTTATPEVNKVTAANLNEIKSVVNSNANIQGDLTSLTTTDKTSLVNAINEVDEITNYYESETVVGKWINGKPIYRKVIISNSISSNISTGISNYEDVVKMQMLVKQTTSGDWRNIPWIFSSGSTLGGAEWAGGFYFSNGVIRNQIGNSLKEISRCIIIMEYTKTTD